MPGLSSYLRGMVIQLSLFSMSLLDEPDDGLIPQWKCIASTVLNFGSNIMQFHGAASAAR